MNKQTKSHLPWDAVVIGASAGGMKALEYLIPALPEGFPLPIIIIQHRGPDSDDFLSQHLNQISQINVKEATEQDTIQANTAYIAPGGYHLLIEDDFSFSLCAGEKISYARPSIDVLFKNVCDVFNGPILAIVLTGANEDAKSGALYIKSHGGTIIVQDPDTAEAPTMPKSVIVSGAADYILSLNEIREFLLNGIR